MHIGQITLTYLRGSATDTSFIVTMQQIGFARALPALGIVSQPLLARSSVPSLQLLAVKLDLLEYISSTGPGLRLRTRRCAINMLTCSFLVFALSAPLRNALLRGCTNGFCICVMSACRVKQNSPFSFYETHTVFNAGPTF